MGLLTTFANRSGDKEVESVSSDDGTTEESTEEETISSTSLGSEEGSAESNPPPKKPVVRKHRKQSGGKQLWQHNLSARSNQDIQRAYEENILKEMSAILNKKTLNDSLARNTRVGRNTTPLGGTWVRLETEWRDSLSARDVPVKSKTMVNNRPNKPRSRF